MASAARCFLPPIQNVLHLNPLPAHPRLELILPICSYRVLNLACSSKIYLSS
jgi:hypothetical protein